MQRAARERHIAARPSNKTGPMPSRASCCLTGAAPPPNSTAGKPADARARLKARRNFARGNLLRPNPSSAAAASAGANSAVASAMPNPFGLNNPEPILKPNQDCKQVRLDAILYRLLYFSYRMLLLSIFDRRGEYIATSVAARTTELFSISTKLTPECSGITKYPKTKQEN